MLTNKKLSQNHHNHNMLMMSFRVLSQREISKRVKKKTQKGMKKMIT